MAPIIPKDFLPNFGHPELLISGYAAHSLALVEYSHCHWHRQREKKVYLLFVYAHKGTRILKRDADLLRDDVKVIHKISLLDSGVWKSDDPDAGRRKTEKIGNNMICGHLPVLRLTFWREVLTLQNSEMAE